MGRKRFVK